MSAALLVPPQHRQKGPPPAPSSTKMVNGILNLGKIGEARLDNIPTVEECKPGLRPVEYNLIIAPARAAETMGALGLIKRSDQDIETEQMALQIGRIIDMSPLAFNYEEWNGCEDKRPQVGDVVWFARYAGGLIEAAFDGNPYRIIKDKDVAAVIEVAPIPHKGAISDEIHALESRCPTEWVDVRVRLQEAYEACPADGT